MRQTAPSSILQKKEPGPEGESEWLSTGRSLGQASSLSSPRRSCHFRKRIGGRRCQRRAAEAPARDASSLPGLASPRQLDQAGPGRAKPRNLEEARQPPSGTPFPTHPLPEARVGAERETGPLQGPALRGAAMRAGGSAPPAASRSAALGCAGGPRSVAPILGWVPKAS